jgi:hypothetical protein
MLATVTSLGQSDSKGPWTCPAHLQLQYFGHELWQQAWILFDDQLQQATQVVDLGKVLATAA